MAGPARRGDIFKTGQQRCEKEKKTHRKQSDKANGSSLSVGVLVLVVGGVGVKWQLRLNSLPGLVAGSHVGVEKLLFLFLFKAEFTADNSTACGLGDAGVQLP